MKRISISIKDLFELPTAEIFNPDEYKPVSHVSIDSRNIANSIFVAIKGERFDGHDFIKNAISNGAKAVVINRSRIESFNNLKIPFVAVEDTTIALGDLAKIWRNKLSAKIIGITGSTGKTSTKEMLAVILNERFTVNKTLANNNNHIGVPLTIFSTTNKHDAAVLELGTNHFGEIEYTANIAKPDYAVITNIGSSHLEFLKNRKGVLKEKIALFDAADKNGGTLFINNDDDLLRKSAGNYKKKITYAFENDAEVKGKISDYTEEGKAVVEVKFKNKKLKEVFPLYGGHNAKNFLPCAAIAFRLGMTKDEISKGIKKLKAVEKRLNVRSHKNFILIDDTYNANPESMKSALELLGRIKTYNKKVALLGDMFELRDKAPVLHKKLLSEIKKNKIDEAYTTGSLMKNLNEALSGSKIKAKHFKSRDKLKKFLQEKDFSDSVVLVKGSRGMKMEEFTNVIEANA